MGAARFLFEVLMIGIILVSFTLAVDFASQFFFGTESLWVRIFKRKDKEK